MMMVLLFTTWFPSVGHATAQEAYDRGLTALREEDWTEASHQLVLALEQGGRDPAVYHALGNSLYRQAEFGHALVAWERGLRLAPRNAELRTNLVTARSQLALDDVSPGEEGVLPWTRKLSARESALGSSLALSAGLLLLWVRRRRSSSERGVMGRLGIAALVVAALLAASAWESERLDAGHIVVGREVTVRSTPGDGGLGLFRLLPGSSVVVLDTSQNQMLIQREDGQKGWIPASAVSSCDPDEDFSPLPSLP